MKIKAQKAFNGVYTVSNFNKHLLEGVLHILAAEAETIEEKHTIKALIELVKRENPIYLTLNRMKIINNIWRRYFAKNNQK